MKTTLTAEEYQDGSPIARAEMDAWLEKMGLIERWVTDIRIIRMVSFGRCIVAVWYYERDSNGRIQRTPSGKPVMQTETYPDAPIPPLNFFELAEA